MTIPDEIIEEECEYAETGRLGCLLPTGDADDDNTDWDDDSEDD